MIMKNTRLILAVHTVVIIILAIVVWRMDHHSGNRLHSIEDRTRYLEHRVIHSVSDVTKGVEEVGKGAKAIEEKVKEEL